MSSGCSRKEDVTCREVDFIQIFNKGYKSSASTFAMNDQLKRSEVKKRRNGKGLAFLVQLGCGQLSVLLIENGHM